MQFERNFILRPEVLEELKFNRKFVIFSGAFLNIFCLVCGYFVTSDSVSFYKYLYEIFSVIYLFSLVPILISYQGIIYSAKRYSLFLAISYGIFFPVLILFILSALFIIENLPMSIIHTLYGIHLAMFLFYTIFYARVWKNIYNGQQGIDYAKKMKAHNWTHNFFNKSNFEDKNEFKNMSIFQKIGEKFALLLLGNAFLIPLLIAMASTGTGGNVPLIIAETVMLFMSPFLYKMIPQIIGMYLYISRIEKENNVTIYNDMWND